MHWTPIDSLVVAAYAAFSIGAGLALRRRGARDVEQYFLGGRALPWWLAGTSIVATSFAADTPLLVTGWVRSDGLWRNWTWWSYAAGGCLAAFVFARVWRRAGVMTKAEIAELRYPGPEGRRLRALLGAIHALGTNVIVLAWVMLAAVKIVAEVAGVGEGTALALACALAVTYSLLAGLWGVVITDLVQFVIAVLGAVVLAVASVRAAGGLEAIVAALPDPGATLAWFPAPGPGTPLDASFWTAPVASLAVWLGVAWWAAENVDGSGTAVQRISACRDERHAALAMIWFTIAHYAVRPWPWIAVALASLVLLPPAERIAPVDGVVVAVEPDRVGVAPEAGGPTQWVGLEVAPGAAGAGWSATPRVALGEFVHAGEVVGRTDEERAYVAMMVRYLPPFWLGLAVVSLTAAFMSTIDTHLNLASSFFVNDIYRRFLDPGASEARAVLVARAASAGVLLLAAGAARLAESISSLYLFLLSFLGGVGPVYLMRWIWWRVRAPVELTAMITSAGVSLAVTALPLPWPDSPWTPGGVPTAAARLALVAIASVCVSLVTLAWIGPPDPARLAAFYRRARPPGAWGAVARAAGIANAGAGALVRDLAGAVAGLALVLGLLIGTGAWLLSQTEGAAVALLVAGAGGAGVGWWWRAIGRPAPSRE